MKTDIFIAESVEILKNNYLRRMLKTKQLFFKCLQENKTSQEFLSEFSKIWNDLDYRFMRDQKKELEKLIDELNNVSPINVTKEFIKTLTTSSFDDVLKKYEKTLERYYESKLSTMENGINDKDLYLSNFVDKYDNQQACIPYRTKEGLIHSYHDIADYSSMLFNTNLTRTAINRTLYDAEYLNKDLVYIPAHNLSCPRCMEWQGRVYSISGKNKRYPKLDEAYSNGMGHPNCKHITVIYWDKSQLQSDRFDSEEWEDKYRIDQKKKAIKREIKKQNSDLKIYKSLNNQAKIDTTKNKIKKLRSRLSEI